MPFCNGRNNFKKHIFLFRTWRFLTLFFGNFFVVFQVKGFKRREVSAMVSLTLSCDRGARKSPRAGRESSGRSGWVEEFGLFVMFLFAGC